MSQTEKVLNHMKENGRITTFEAFMTYNITRLSARIYDLKEQGYQIARLKPESHNAHYTVYSLVQ